MASPDTNLRTYLRAFFSDWFTGMSGPLSVPFAAIALWSSGRVQKVLWGCLAVAVGVFGSYRVWRKERVDASSQLESLRAEKDASIIALNERVAELSRKPYSEDLERCVNQLLDQMTYQGWLLLRHLLMRERVELGRSFMHGDIPIEIQNAQMGIAMNSGVVKHDAIGQGPLVRTYYVINQQFRPVLERVLYARLEEQQR